MNTPFAPTETDLVALAWDDLVALHSHLERNPSLRNKPAFIGELLETHQRYVAVFNKWART